MALLKNGSVADDSYGYVSTAEQIPDNGAIIIVGGFGSSGLMI